MMNSPMYSPTLPEFLQLARQGNTWKVVTILWDAERPDNPLPEKYLPNKSVAQVSRPVQGER